MKNTLFLFTKSYPYSYAAETNFLNQEIIELKEHFDDIYIIPEFMIGDKVELDKPIKVVETLDQYRRNRWIKLACAFRSINLSFFKEVFAKFPRSFHPFSFARTFKYYMDARVTGFWAKEFFKNVSNHNSIGICYTWWCDHVTLGISSLKSRRYNFALVSRMHGYDLYENRHKAGYIPFRKQALEKLDKIYPDSFAGEKYLKEKYPAMSHKITSSLLGVHGAGQMPQIAANDRFRFVSCSFMIGLKRVNMIVEAVASLASAMPEHTFEYFHFGDGPLRISIEELASNKMPSNVVYRFPGYTGLEDVYSYYRSNYIMAFINASETEGTPVAIMEAISFGIPVIATGVGGNKEIVQSKNGLLLDKDFSIEELKNAMQCLVSDPGYQQKLSRGSYEVWDTFYNANKNYTSFVSDIKSINQ